MNHVKASCPKCGGKNVVSMVFNRISCSDCQKVMLTEFGRAKMKQIKVNVDKLRACNHERLDEDGVCRSCGADCRGIH